MTSEKITVAKGVLPDKKTLKRFLSMLEELEIGKDHHHAKPMEKAEQNGSFHITLYIKGHADSLIRASLKEGMLRHWGQFFQFEN